MTDKIDPTLAAALCQEDRARQTMEARISLYRAAIAGPDGIGAATTTMARQDLLEAVNAWLNQLEVTAVCRFTIYFGGKS